MKTLVHRSRSPLRLGLAGGGTDVSPYCDEFGGCVLNVTIDMYVHCTIEPQTTGEVVFCAADKGETVRLPSHASPAELDLDGPFGLFKAVYKRISRDFLGNRPLSFNLTTYSDAPPGSGLGSSSTLVVSMLKAFQEWLKLPMGDYDIAHLAFEIERLDVGLSGGKQDQYAATFGGFNFMEFHADDRVIVNPLRIKADVVNELESSLVLYFTGVSRDSAKIIDEQIVAAKRHTASIDAMHQIKAEALILKELLLRGDLVRFTSHFNKSWEAKKRTAAGVTNPFLEEVYSTARDAGALAGKVSGAGGGGFMMFIVEPTRKCAVVNALRGLGGRVVESRFTQEGSQSWSAVPSFPTTPGAGPNLQPLAFAGRGE